MSKGNWWSKAFNSRVKAIEELDLVYRRKWDRLDWTSGNLRREIENNSGDKWNKTLKLLNEIATSNSFPFTLYGCKRREEDDYRNWHDVHFSKEDIEEELLRIFKEYPKYSAHTDEGIRNDELYQSMINMMGFMQDVGAYYGVVRTGYTIDSSIIETYITGSKDRYNSIMNEILQKHDDMFSKLYKLKNIDSDIDAILNLEDKEEAKRKIKEMVMSHCRTIYDKDNESMIEVKNIARMTIKEFVDKNKNIMRLSKFVNNDKCSKDDTLEALKKLLEDSD